MRITVICLLLLFTAAQAQTSPEETADSPDAPALLDEQAPAAESPPSADSPTPETIPVEPRKPDDELPAMSEPAGPRPAALEEIVVTATKRATSVREIPATIAVFTGEDLEREGIQSIEQIVPLVPGVNLNDDGMGNSKRITIRGISNETLTNFTAGTLLGDIPFTEPFAPKVPLDPNPFDMATVEVLKGPQGTLFGASGLNGMIRYVPQAPDFSGRRVKYFAQLNAFPGNGDSDWSYGAAVNLPFASDTAAVRLMGFQRDAPGYTDDTKNGKSDVNRISQYGYRGILAWHPNDDWKISLLGARQHTLTEDSAFTDNYDGDLSRGNTPRASPIMTDYSVGSLTVERIFEWGDVSSQTSLFEKTLDLYLDASRIVPGGPVSLISATAYDFSKAMAQEFRVVSPDDGGPWKWLGGLFYYDMSVYDCTAAGAADIPGLPALPPLPIGDGLVPTTCPELAGHLQGALNAGQIVADIGVKEYALFGEVTRTLGESWEATLGARFYRTESGGEVVSSGITYAPQNYGMVGRSDASVAESGISPKASIVYQPTDELRSYFTVSRGFRFGGPQIGAPTLTTPNVPPVYKSDYLWSYEFGVRTDWLDQTLRIDSSIYHIEWKDPQVKQVSADQLVKYIDNVGGVEGTGVDLTVRYLPPFLSGLTLETSGSWNKTVTTEAFDDVSGTHVEPGSPWALAPRWQTSTSLSYLWPLESLRLVTGVRHTYLSKACGEIVCDAYVYGYRTWNLNLSIASASNPLLPELSLSVTNLTDERGISNIITSPVGDAINYIAPRAVVVRIGGSF